LNPVQRNELNAIQINESHQIPKHGSNPVSKNGFNQTQVGKSGPLITDDSRENGSVQPDFGSYTMYLIPHNYYLYDLAAFGNLENLFRDQ
jgi:hypothetical protein